MRQGCFLQSLQLESCGHCANSPTHNGTQAFTIDLGVTDPKSGAKYSRDLMHVDLGSQNTARLPGLLRHELPSGLSVLNTFVNTQEAMLTPLPDLL